MPSLALGLGLSKNKTAVYSGLKLDAQAVAHYDRVIADDGIIPAGLLGCNAWFVAVKAVYAVTDITTAISAGYDPHYLGAKIGAGSGTTLGQAATKLYSCSGASGDLVQATAASMPLLLVKNSTDANYYFSPQVNNNNCSTPSVSIDTTSGMSVEAQVSFTTNDDASNSGGWICANDNGGVNRNMFLGWSGSRTLILYWANLSRSATATAQIPAAYSGWIKASLETSGADMLAKFWTSTDGVTWTQLGATITNAGGANTFQTAASPFYVTGNGTSNNIAGKIYRVIYRNAIGTARADFNPASYNAATSQTQWTSTTGEVWTINKSSGNTFVGVLVDRTLIQGNNSTTSMSVTIAGTQPYTEYLTATKNGVGTYVSRATGNARGHSGTNLTLANGTTLNFASTATTRQTMTYRNNGASSGIAVNNGTETTGNAGTNNGTTLVLAEGAHNITTFISSLTNDSAPQRAAMYTAVKSFNNY